MGYILYGIEIFKPVRLNRKIIIRIIFQDEADCPSPKNITEEKFDNMKRRRD